MSHIQIIDRCYWETPWPCRPISQCQSKPVGKSEGKVAPSKTILLPFLKSTSCSAQSTVSFVVSHGPERKLLDLDPGSRLKTSSSDLEKLKTSSSELKLVEKSSSFELEKFQKSSDLPSEVCKLRKELSDLKLAESLPEKLTAQIVMHQRDPNSNCENCAECVL